MSCKSFHVDGEQDGRGCVLAVDILTSGVAYTMVEAGTCNFRIIRKEKCAKVPNHG